MLRALPTFQRPQGPITVDYIPAPAKPDKSVGPSELDLLYARARGTWKLGTTLLKDTCKAFWRHRVGATATAAAGMTAFGTAMAVKGYMDMHVVDTFNAMAAHAMKETPDTSHVTLASAHAVNELGKSGMSLGIAVSLALASLGFRQGKRNGVYPLEPENNLIGVGTFAPESPRSELFEAATRLSSDWQVLAYVDTADPESLRSSKVFIASSFYEEHPEFEVPDGAVERVIADAEQLLRDNTAEHQLVLTA